MPVSQHRDKRSKTQSAVGLPPGYAALHGGFGWQVPQHFNMAQACSQRWAALPDATKRVAVRAYSTRASSTFYTYSELQAQANRLSNVLRTDRKSVV